MLSGFGPYRIEGTLGEGGMGQVYRATDTTLGRQVAIKVLSSAWAGDPDRVARFEREARTLASLSHPHIAAVYGFEKVPAASSGDADTHALVMELVEGEDLSQRLCRGPLPAEEALLLAAQVADAVAAAHDRGIVHRDLKPANIKVTPAGHAKVLDFGLAKAVEGALADARSDTATAAVTSPAMTQAGMLLGTAAYMSPEQARGLAVTRRADVWAFGCVLYEMLTARRAFPRDDVALTLSALLTREPDYAALPATVPPRVVATIRACLRKDPRQRAADLHDVRLALDGVFDSGTHAPEPALPPRRRGAWQAGAAMMAVAAFAIGWALKPTPARAPLPVVRSAIHLPPEQSFSEPGYPSVAISPDAARVAYVANAQLFIRRLDALKVTPVPGVAGLLPVGVAFSPDSQWLAFYSRTTNSIHRIPVAGGAAVALTHFDDVLPVWGLRWEVDDTILFVRSRGIFRVPATGGTPDLLVEADPGRGAFDAPQLLPGGRALLFAAETRPNSNYWEEAEIVVRVLASKEQHVVWSGGAHPLYVPSGHLLFARVGTLMAVTFDLDRLAVTGTPVQALDDLETSTSIGIGGLGAHYSVSRDGVLTYLPTMTRGVERSLVWMNRSSGEEEKVLTTGEIYDPEISPDGTRLAFAADDAGGNTDLWVMDAAGGTARRLTTGAGVDRYPLWSADGRALFFHSPQRGVLSTGVSGNSAELLLLESADRFVVPWSRTSSPLEILTTELTTGAAGNFDVGRLTVGPLTTRTGLLESTALEAVPELSPDGRWMLYGGSEAGPGAYVRPYPDVTSSVAQVLSGSGVDAVWTRGGREIVYRDGDAIAALPIDTSRGVEVGRPQILFRGDFFAEVGRQWDVTPDGNRFLMLKRSGADGAVSTRRVLLVQHWFEELRTLAPGR